MARKQMNVFSLSFLDAMTCGFGAVILFFMIINANIDPRSEVVLEDLSAEVDRMELKVLTGRKNLVQLKDDLAKLIEEDKDFRASLLSGVQSHGLSNGLQRFEMPAKLVLTADEWTPDSGLVTAAFKIRRRHIVDKYRDRLEEVYV